MGGVTTSEIAGDRTESTRRFRCAMFVDFDNVYIGLRRLDPDAAEAFATDPGHWLAALESGTDSEGEFTREPVVGIQRGDARVRRGLDRLAATP